MAMRVLIAILINLYVSGMAYANEPLRRPDVKIIAEKNRVVYEFRQNGHLKMVRVVPNFGKPYYLIPKDPTQGVSGLERVDALVPSWTLWEFEPPAEN